MAKLVIVLAALMLAGCAHSPSATMGLCALGPVRPREADKLTRETAERIILENETGEKVCGWKP